MKKIRMSLLTLCAAVLFIPSTSIWGQNISSQKTTVILPVDGNTWASPTPLKDDNDSSEIAIAKWNDSTTSYNTYIYVDKPGKIFLYIKAKISQDKAKIKVTVEGQSHEIALSNKDYQDVFIGEYNVVEKGYVSINTQGLFTNPKQQVSIEHFKLQGDVLDQNTAYVKDNEGNFFYWGRRGPSTHLNYEIPVQQDIEYYYNEITVPIGNDIIGSYYMANGFKGGYFGMQVNSATERRVLFSVWSPFVTDDPNAIPEDHKIILLDKSQDVQTGEFGNEGSGGQSYLRYNWQAGQTYKFLLKGTPSKNNYTTYTAWFWTPETQQWKLIASFDRPHTNSYLTGFHSFLENFIPEQGIYEREVMFNNQWVRDTKGTWHEVTKTRFSADNTARVGYRVDYGGGTKNGAFYLRNCGFFSPRTEIGTQFEREALKAIPNIDFDTLP